MKTLDIRSFALGMAVMVALAIGAFVALSHGEESAQAAPDAPGMAQPQGNTTDLYFQCASYGITILMNADELANYKCSSDADVNIDCVYNFTQTAVTCSIGGNTSVCQLTASFPDEPEAECTDSAGSDHNCILADIDGAVTCTTLDNSIGKDFVSCDYQSRFEPFICSSENGPIVCMATPDTLLEIVCATLTSLPQGLWADVDCNGNVNVRDQQSILKVVLGNTPLGQTEPCPDISDSFSYRPDGQ